MAPEVLLRQYNGGDSNVPSLVLNSLRRQNTKPFLQSSLVYLGWEGVRVGMGGGPNSDEGTVPIVLQLYM
jgi:hypothetical protein